MINQKKFTAIPELLELINIENFIITLDAMGCQKDIASKIIEKDRYYCFVIKENKKNFYLNIKGLYYK